MAKKTKEDEVNLIGLYVNIRLTCPVNVIGTVIQDIGDALIVETPDAGKVWIPADKIQAIWMDQKKIEEYWKKVPPTTNTTNAGDYKQNAPQTQPGGTRLGV